MKRIYIPTMDELYLIQDMVNGHNLYKYILVKAIESLTMEGINYPNKGILKSAYKYLRENPEIAYAICRMYPEEIKYSEIAQNDTRLCLDLITDKLIQDETIYRLDNLFHFEKGIGVLSNQGVIGTTAHILATKLPSTPTYRFEYKPNSLLDDIFACQIPTEDIPNAFSNDFTIIEPAYTIKLDEHQLRNFLPEYEEKSHHLERSINKYTERYGVTGRDGWEYRGKDILTNPDENVKRLLKCIKEHQKKY